MISSAQRIEPFRDSMLANVEAEAALIGAALIDNEVFDSCQSLRSNDFSFGLHERIWTEIGRQREAGNRVSPVTLKPIFEGDAEIKDLGGIAYLAQLTADGGGLLASRELAEQICDMAERRRRIEWATNEAAAAYDLTKPLGEMARPPEVNGGQVDFLDLCALSKLDPLPKQFILPGIAPRGEVTLLTGAGAIGKSLLAQQLATCIATGRKTLGFTPTRAPAIYITAEDDADQLHFRQQKICKALGCTMEALSGWLFLASRRGLQNSLCTTDYNGQIRGAPLLSRLAEQTKRLRADILFLDNVAHLFPGDENNRGEVTNFVNLLNKLAGDTQTAVVLLGHPNKSGADYSGSTAWINAVRSQITMERPSDAELDADLRSLRASKANYGPSGELLRFRWHDWSFIRDEDLPPDTQVELAHAIAISGENEAFLTCLRARAQEGEARQVGPSPGPTYAPTQFEGMPEAKGYERTALKRAMERLRKIGRIEFVEVERPGKSARKTIIREVPELSPNLSRTLSRTHPEQHPSAALTLPEHTSPLKGGVSGTPCEGPRNSIPSTSIAGEFGQ